MTKGVLYALLVAVAVGCVNPDRLTDNKTTPQKRKLWVKYTDNTVDTLMLSQWEIENLQLTYNHVLYTYNRVIANDVRTYGNCN